MVSLRLRVEEFAVLECCVNELLEVADFGPVDEEGGHWVRI